MGDFTLNICENKFNDENFRKEYEISLMLIARVDYQVCSSRIFAYNRMLRVYHLMANILIDD